MPCARCGRSGSSLVVAAAGLLSGGAAGGAPTADALITVTTGLLPDSRAVPGRAVGRTGAGSGRAGAAAASRPRRHR